MHVSRSADGQTYDVQLGQTGFRRVLDRRGGLIQEGSGPSPADRYKLETIRDGTRATSLFVDQSGNRVTIAADGTAEVKNKDKNSGFIARLGADGYKYKHRGVTPGANFEFTVSTAADGSETVKWSDGTHEVTAHWPRAKPAGRAAAIASPFSKVQPDYLGTPGNTIIGALKESFVEQTKPPSMTDKFGKTVHSHPQFDAGSVTATGTVITIRENGSLSLARPDGTQFTLNNIDGESGTYYVSTFGSKPEDARFQRLGNGVIVKTGTTTTRETTDGMEITHEGPRNTAEKWIKHPDGGFTYGKRDERGWISWQDSPEAATHAKAKLTELQEKYHVKFTTTGSGEIEGTTIQWRTPTMHELRALEAAMERSPQSAAGAEFRFYDGPALKIGTAYHDVGTIVFGPQLGLIYDHLLQSAATGGYGSLYATTFEATATHELAHYGGFKRDHKDWYNGSYERQLGRELGFRQIVDESPDGKHKTIWARRASNGDLYKRLQLHNDNSAGVAAAGASGTVSWIRCDQNGKVIDPKERPLDDLQMREISECKPPTPYADNPLEVIAEATTCLRLGEKSRERMLRESPAVYAVAKREDQAEIDRTNLTVKDYFGKVVFGWMRDLSGHVVMRSQNTIDNVEAFEHSGEYIRARPSS
jgi:hypothetical protein